MPEIPEAFGYLLGFFFSAGQVSQSGMGITPLSWQEIRAFRKENKLHMTIFERELLKRMSDAYCSEYSRASDPKRPAPYTPERKVDEEVDQIAKAMNIMESFRAFRKT